MFRRIVSAAQYKNLDFINVLSYELTPIPTSIFHEDSTMRKTAKSDLANKLESFSDILYEPPSAVQSYFIDGMVLLQELNEKTFKTFENLADVVLKRLLFIFTENKECHTISLIFDRYDIEYSVKGLERQKRGETKLGTYAIIGSRTVPNYRNFLKSTMNKMSLIKFLTQHLMSISGKLPPGKELLVAGGLQDGSSCIKVYTFMHMIGVKA